MKRRGLIVTNSTSLDIGTGLEEAVQRWREGDAQAARGLFRAVEFRLGLGLTLPPLLAEWMADICSKGAEGASLDKWLQRQNPRGRPPKKARDQRIRDEHTINRLSGMTVENSNGQLADKYSLSEEAIVKAIGTKAYARADFVAAGMIINYARRKPVESVAEVLKAFRQVIERTGDIKDLETAEAIHLQWDSMTERLKQYIEAEVKVNNSD